MIPRLLHLGIHDTTPPNLMRSIRAVNVFCVLCIAIGFVTIPFLAVLGVPGGTYFVPVAADLVLLVCLYLNHRGRYWLGSSLVVLMFLAMLTGWAFAFGVGSGIQYHFLMLMTAAVVVYPWSQRWTAASASVVSVAGFFALTFFGDSITPYVAVPADAMRMMFVFSQGIALSLIGFFTYYGQYLTVTAERRIVERSQELAAALEELQQTQLFVVEAESQAAIGRLAAGVAHEIHTPLGVLRSGVDTLARVLDRCAKLLGQERVDLAARDRALQGAEQCKTLRGAMDAAVLRVGGVTTALAEFAALDEGARETVDLRTCIENAVTLLAGGTGGRVTFSVHLPDQVVSVTGSSTRLNRAVLALLDNAVESPGVTHVTVSLERGDGAVNLTVSDDGEGLSPELLGKAFDIGFVTRGKRVGMGLRLPLAKHTIESLGGKLTLDSRVGAGTTARIELAQA